MPVVERARVAEVRLVEELAHPRLDPDADPGGRVAAVEVDDEAQEGEPADGREIRREQVLLWGRIALSIACWIRIGIAIEISV